MSNLRDRFIEQCNAEEVLSNIIEWFVRQPIDRGIAQKDLDAKTTLVAAINAMGGSASASMTWEQLAQQIVHLTVLDNNIVFTDNMPFPFDMSKFISNPSAYKPYIKEIHSTSQLTIEDYAFRYCTNLEVVDMPNVTSVGQYAFSGCSKLKEVNFPNATNGLSYSFENCGSLQKVIVPKVPSFYNAVSSSSNVYQINVLKCTSFPYAFGSSKLIDLIVGEDFNQNYALPYYNPTEAYRSDSSSLCFDTDLAEYGQVFSTNWDKWKWCIIHHMAANLPDRTGLTPFTIAFGSSAFAKFDQDMKDAFTNRGWEASA